MSETLDCLTDLLHGEPRPARSFWIRVVLPVMVAGLAMLGLAGGGLWWAAARSDTISVERQMRLADAAIGASIDALPQAQLAYAVWDEPVLRLKRAPDPDWFRVSIGVQLDYLFPDVETYLLNPDDRALYGYGASRSLPVESFEAIRPALARMIEEVRGRVRPQGHARDRLLDGGPPPRSTGAPGRNDYVVFAAHLARVHDRPAAVSIMRIVPTSPQVVQARGGEPLLVTIRYLNAPFLSELAHQHLLAAPRFAERSDAREGEAAMRLADDDGQEVGWLIWRPELAGTRLLRTMGPITALAGLAIAGVLALLVARLRDAMQRVEASEAEARHLALHDPLTSLPNRALFEDRLDQAIGRARRGRTAALLVLDLDRFKAVNDTLGHAAGDGVLREFARRLRAMLRTGDTAARFGGDEFGVILTDVRCRGDVEAVCERILAATARPIGLPEGIACVGASIGVAIMPEAGPNRTEVMRAADRALYWAKADGRECYRLFDSDPEAQMRAAA